MPWAPHHLGFWPLANLPAARQENMPLEETAWDLLIIAAIAQRQGGDLAWLEPYWPVIETWYGFLITLLPFPQEQLSTDDFDGPLYNATNLAVKVKLSFNSSATLIVIYSNSVITCYLSPRSATLTNFGRQGSGRYCCVWIYCRKILWEHYSC